MRPIIRLRALASPPPAEQPPLSAFRLRRSLAWPVGQAEALFPPGPAPLAVGTRVVAEGTMDGSAFAALFTGSVLRGRSGHWQTELLAEEATGPLARLYVEKVIESGTAAGAVSDLCDAAGVSGAVESPGATLSFLALWGNRTAADHILQLARLSGWLVRTDASGKLHVGAAPAAPGSAVVGPADYVLDLRVEEEDGGAEAGTFTGDGAYAAKGAGAESWLTRSLSDVQAGSGLPLTRLPALHMAADLSRLATAEGMRLQERRRRRTLLLAGLPPADLGEIFRLQGFAAGNGPVRVAAIELNWSAGSGLVCRLDLHGVGG